NWEQVFGADQPLTAGDIPIMENALCRCVFEPATGRFDVQAWTGSAWVMDATVAPLGAVFSTWGAAVVEWTPERGVLILTARADSGTRAQMFVTLQRGWSGPRVDYYLASVSGTRLADVAVYARSAGDATLQRSSGTVAIVTGASLGTFAALAPWALLLGPGTDRAIHLAVLQAGLELIGSTFNSREGVIARADSYVSLWVGLGDRATGAADAAAHGERGLYDCRSVPELVGRAI
ncbi:MAG: hypothetical protein WKF96_08125, partial [Solirubrobacteraceae bacterium]